MNYFKWRMKKKESDKWNEYWISCYFVTFYMLLEQEAALFTYLTYFHIFTSHLFAYFRAFCKSRAFVDWLFMQIEDSPLSLNCFSKQPRAPQAHPIPPSGNFLITYILCWIYNKLSMDLFSFLYLSISFIWILCFIFFN